MKSAFVSVVSEFWWHEDVEVYVDRMGALRLAWSVLVAFFRGRSAFDCFDSEGEGYALRVHVKHWQDHPNVVRPTDHWRDDA